MADREDLPLTRAGTGSLALPEERRDEPASIGPLLRRLGRDSATLLRQEIELAKSELAAAGRRAARAGGWIAGGGFVALIGTLFLIAALVVALGALLDSYPLAALLVGGLFVAVGALLGGVAARRMKRLRIAPEATLAMLQDDGRWARAELQQLKTDLKRSPE